MWYRNYLQRFQISLVQVIWKGSATNLWGVKFWGWMDERYTLCAIIPSILAWTSSLHLFFFRKKNVLFHNLSYNSSQWWEQWSNLSQTYVFLVSILRSAANHMPLKYRGPDHCYVGIRHAYLIYAPCPLIMGGFKSHVIKSLLFSFHVASVDSFVWIGQCLIWLAITKILEIVISSGSKLSCRSYKRVMGRLSFSFTMSHTPFQLPLLWCLYSEHVFQSHCTHVFLVFVCNYRPCHMSLEYKCLMKNHIWHTCTLSLSLVSSRVFWFRT